MNGAGNKLSSNHLKTNKSFCQEWTSNLTAKKKQNIAKHCKTKGQAPGLSLPCAPSPGLMLDGDDADAGRSAADGEGEAGRFGRLASLDEASEVDSDWSGEASDVSDLDALEAEAEEDTANRDWSGLVAPNNHPPQTC